MKLPLMRGPGDMKYRSKNQLDLLDCSNTHDEGMPPIEEFLYGKKRIK